MDSDTPKLDEAARFRALSENSLDLIVEILADGTIAYINPVVVWMGLDAKAVVGTSAFEWVHPDDRMLLTDAFAARLADKEPVVRPIARLRWHDSWARFEIIGNAYTLPTGERRLVMNARVLGRDTRVGSVDEYADRLAAAVELRTMELQSANRRLRELQSRLVAAERLGAAEDLAGSIAHAINNPLTALIGSAAMALEREHTSEMDRVMGLARRVQDVVWRTLRLFRKGTLRRAPEDLASILRETAGGLGERAGELGVNVIVFTDEVPEAAVDRALLSTAIESVLENALEAAGKDGRVVLSLSWLPDAKAACISIDDSGPGIPDAIVGRIFEPFFTTKGGGTGLGLSIARGIVRGHEGRITVGSGTSGGTSVRIELPL